MIAMTKLVAPKGFRILEFSNKEGKVRKYLFRSSKLSKYDDNPIYLDYYKQTSKYEHAWNRFVHV